MEHPFVHRVSRLFPSSLMTSCQFRTVTDVVESSIPITKILHDDGLDIISTTTTNNITGSRRHRHMKSVVKKTPEQLLIISATSDNEGRKCPPVTPVSVLPPLLTTKNVVNMSCSSNSTTGGWFSSSTSDHEDEERDEVGSGGGAGFESDAFFSLLSSSSESFRLKIDNTTDQLGRCLSGISTKSANSSRRGDRTTFQPPPPPAGGGKVKQIIIRDNDDNKVADDKCSSTELYYGNTKPKKLNRRSRNAPTPSRVASINYSKSSGGGNRKIIEESYAVEKNSDDPRGDFRTSMLEMIIEKQIFCAEDLERLLFCFLSLNSNRYHRIIVEVFTEICDTLFTN